MRTTFEEEEELAPLHTQPERELTLSSTTLLAIFFGLVLICGLFFGLGYTLGRRAPSESVADAIPSPAATAEPSTSAFTGPSQKPSAGTQTAVPAAQQSSEPATSDAPDEAQPADANPAPAMAQTLDQAKPVAAQTVVQPAPGISQPAAIPAGVMVQIAAVSNPADADVLIGALQKRGYTVAARRQASDPLIHVQIGPFSSRADAVAMRQKLLGDGYNAILK
jgi:DedD protein